MKKGYKDKRVGKGWRYLHGLTSASVSVAKIWERVKEQYGVPL